MTIYYAQINSKGKVTGISTATIIKDEYGSTDVKNIVATEEQFKNFLTLDIDDKTYISNFNFENGQLVPNPEFDALFLEDLKQEKYKENDEKAKAARYTQEFTLTIQDQECVFDTSNGTQEDLNTTALYCIATQQTYDDWVTNNGIHLNLTLEDVGLIARTFKEKSNVYLKWDEYRLRIKNARTIAGLNRIRIEY